MSMLKLSSINCTLPKSDLSVKAYCRSHLFFFLNANERKFIAEKEATSHIGKNPGRKGTRAGGGGGQRMSYQLMSKLLGGIRCHLTLRSVLLHMTFLRVQTESNERKILALCSGRAVLYFLRVLDHSNLP
jgi:hypothetical protein